MVDLILEIEHRDLIFTKVTQNFTELATQNRPESAWQPSLTWHPPSSKPFRPLTVHLELLYLWASQEALVVKSSIANTGDIRDTSLMPGMGRSPGGENGNPPQYSSLENPHGQRSLAGCSSWGCKGLDTYIVVYVCQSQSPNLSLPPSLAGNHKFIFYICNSVSLW